MCTYITYIILYYIILYYIILYYICVYFIFLRFRARKINALFCGFLYFVKNSYTLIHSNFFGRWVVTPLPREPPMLELRTWILRKFDQISAFSDFSVFNGPENLRLETRSFKFILEDLRSGFVTHIAYQSIWPQL